MRSVFQSQRCVRLRASFVVLMPNSGAKRGHALTAEWHTPTASKLLNRPRKPRSVRLGLKHLDWPLPAPYLAAFAQGTESVQQCDGNR
jgi:hypothetical protein